MSAHTEGRLIVNGTLIYFSGTDGGFDLRDCPSPEENARRLAACWNMCDGIDLENIEQGMPLVERINVYAGQVAAFDTELAAARALLTEILTADDEMIAELRADGIALDTDGGILLTERIRAFLKAPA